MSIISVHSVFLHVVLRRWKAMHLVLLKQLPGLDREQSTALLLGKPQDEVTSTKKLLVHLNWDWCRVSNSAVHLSVNLPVFLSVCNFVSKFWLFTFFWIFAWSQGLINIKLTEPIFWRNYTQNVEYDVFLRSKINIFELFFKSVH